MPVRIKRHFVTLAGPSGSGKTTLLNIIGGFGPADSRSVMLNGNALEEMTQSKLANLRLNKIGFVFQSYNLLTPVLSALEDLEFVMLLQGMPAAEPRKWGRRIFDDARGGKYDPRPAELSGGKQQRAGVARVIVSRPAIVLADEPTATWIHRPERAY